MDFRIEATIEAVKRLVASQIMMLVLHDEHDEEGVSECVENRNVVLKASEKAWRHVRARWTGFERDDLESAVMTGFMRAVEERQDMDYSDYTGSSNKKVLSYVEAFEPSSLIDMG